MLHKPMLGKHICLAAIAAFLFGIAHSTASLARPQGARQWVSSWASAQIGIDPKETLPVGADMTLRQLIRVSLGGGAVRLRISNAFGNSPLEIKGVNVARAISPASSLIEQSSNRVVTLNGAQTVSIPAGAEYLSDPIALPVAPFTTLAVSIHFAGLPQRQTGHPGSRATSYLASGDQRSAASLNDATKIDRWYYLDGVDVRAVKPSAAIAVIGDSIVDGHGVVSNSNRRWTDYLAERLEGHSLALLNVGIGSNCLAQNCVGPNVPSRFDRDVLSRSGVEYVIILEGVNDLGMLTRDAPVAPEAHRALVRRMIGALAQVIKRAHERGIKVIGATIMPYGASDYYHPDLANDSDREAVNAWLRSRGHVDAVIDFDAMMRDPARPNRLKKQFDSGDGLHPSPEGYRFMGDIVALSLFAGGDR